LGDLALNICQKLSHNPLLVLWGYAGEYTIGFLQESADVWRQACTRIGGF